MQETIDGLSQTARLGQICEISNDERVERAFLECDNYDRESMVMMKVVLTEIEF